MIADLFTSLLVHKKLTLLCSFGKMSSRACLTKYETIKDDNNITFIHIDRHILRPFLLRYF